MIRKKTSYQEDECFILRSEHYKETSLLLEVLSKNHGRFNLIAKGARRPRSELRGQLLMFQPLLIKWFGEQALKNLASVEWLGRGRFMYQFDLVAAFYLSELITLFMPMASMDQQVFVLYQESLDMLQSGTSHSIRRTVRIFECSILKLTGLLPDFSRDAFDNPLDDDEDYVFTQPGRPILLRALPVEKSYEYCTAPGVLLKKLHQPELLTCEELDMCKNLFHWMIRSYNSKHIVTLCYAQDIKTIREKVIHL
jgi:recombinational DNA repair protein (RecF pathway)